MAYIFSLCQGRPGEKCSRSHGLVSTMKNFVGCLSLAVLTAIATSGCNKAAYQSALATPNVPALIGNTDQLESQLSIARLQEHQGQLREATDRYKQLAAKNPKNAEWLSTIQKSSQRTEHDNSTWQALLARQNKAWLYNELKLELNSQIWYIESQNFKIQMKYPLSPYKEHIL